MRAVTAVLAVGVFVLATPAAAKDFEPCDLRVCSARSCVIVDGEAVALLRPFHYSGPARARASAPRRGTPYFELRFSNGYVTGIATR
jgi:hypothetical protein